VVVGVATRRTLGPLEKGREVALPGNLRVLRVTLDKFHADKGRFPETLDELVEERYLREVPLDPITESATTWVLVPPKEPDQQGVADVKSGASGTARYTHTDPSVPCTRPSRFRARTVVGQSGSPAPRTDESKWISVFLRAALLTKSAPKMVVFALNTTSALGA